jgi:hypothetical protein
VFPLIFRSLSAAMIKDCRFAKSRCVKDSILVTFANGGDVLVTSHPARTPGSLDVNHPARGRVVVVLWIGQRDVHRAGASKGKPRHFLSGAFDRVAGSLLDAEGRPQNGMVSIWPE